MLFNTHSNLVGQHAFLGPSKYHWINYDPEKLATVYANAQMAERGVRLHALAHEAINLGVKMPRTAKSFNMYVNDAIGYRMTTEQILFYSLNCYGTCDTISFRNNLLRIHDLKTGIIAGAPSQLEIYTAIFCLEYNKKPGEIDIELRIYQDENDQIWNPDVDIIAHIMSKIITFDKQLEKLKIEG